MSKLELDTTPVFELLKPKLTKCGLCEGPIGPLDPVIYEERMTGRDCTAQTWAYHPACKDLTSGGLREEGFRNMFRHYEGPTHFTFNIIERGHLLVSVLQRVLIQLMRERTKKKTTDTNNYIKSSRYKEEQVFLKGWKSATV